ncbi:hypothetical protein [Bowmanella yangjiangensis]|nr:hypothetical protein [Bowmanella yangjiangensis]
MQTPNKETKPADIKPGQEQKHAQGNAPQKQPLPQDKKQQQKR